MMEELQHDEWEILDDNAAEWAVSKIMEARSDTDKWEAHYACQLEAVRRRNAETEAFMTAKLERYFDILPHKKTKTQESYTLPSAKLIRKIQQPKYVRDDKTLVQWLKGAAPELVKIVELPNWLELKKRLIVMNGSVFDRETGENVPCVTLEEPQPVFLVNAKENKANE